MFSAGAQPYEGLSCDQTVVYIDEGGRLTRPDNCPLYVHQLMSRCWQHRPTDRPSARRLFNLLADAVTSRDRDVTDMTSSLQQVSNTKHCLHPLVPKHGNSKMSNFLITVNMTYCSKLLGFLFYFLPNFFRSRAVR